MSGAKITIRAPPHRDFVQGYPGIPAAPPHRPRAHLAGTVEVRPAKPLHAAYLHLELKKLETLPGSAPANRFNELIGAGPTVLWRKKDNEEYSILGVADFSFEIPIPEGLPPSVLLDPKSGAGISYTIVATLCSRPKKGLFRSSATEAKPVYTTATTPTTLVKHELHSGWPLYHPDPPNHQEVASDGVTLGVTRWTTGLGPGDELWTRVKVESDKVRPIKVVRFEISLREITTFRYGAAGASTITASVTPAQSKVSGNQQRYLPVLDVHARVGKQLFHKEIHSFDVKGVLPSSHARVTVRTAKHLEVAYLLRVRCVCEGVEGGEVVVDHLPVTVGDRGRKEALAMCEKIGHVPRFCPPRLSAASSPPHSQGNAARQPQTVAARPSQTSRDPRLLALGAPDLPPTQSEMGSDVTQPGSITGIGARATVATTAAASSALRNAHPPPPNGAAGIPPPHQLQNTDLGQLFLSDMGAGRRGPGGRPAGAGPGSTPATIATGAGAGVGRGQARTVGAQRQTRHSMLPGGWGAASLPYGAGGGGVDQRKAVRSVYMDPRRPGGIDTTVYNVRGQGDGPATAPTAGEGSSGARPLLEGNRQGMGSTTGAEDWGRGPESEKERLFRRAREESEAAVAAAAAAAAAIVRSDGQGDSRFGTATGRKAAEPESPATSSGSGGYSRDVYDRTRAAKGYSDVGVVGSDGEDGDGGTEVTVTMAEPAREGYRPDGVEERRGWSGVADGRVEDWAKRAANGGYPTAEEEKTALHYEVRAARESVVHSPVAMRPSSFPSSLSQESSPTSSRGSELQAEAHDGPPPPPVNMRTRPPTVRYRSHAVPSAPPSQPPSAPASRSASRDASPLIDPQKEAYLRAVREREEYAARMGLVSPVLPTQVRQWESALEEKERLKREAEAEAEAAAEAEARDEAGGLYVGELPTVSPADQGKAPMRRSDTGRSRGSEDSAVYHRDPTIKAGKARAVDGSPLLAGGEHRRFGAGRRSSGASHGEDGEDDGDDASVYSPSPSALGREWSAPLGSDWRAVSPFDAQGVVGGLGMTWSNGGIGGGSGGGYFGGVDGTAGTMARTKSPPPPLPPKIPLL